MRRRTRAPVGVILLLLSPLLLSGCAAAGATSTPSSQARRLLQQVVLPRKAARLASAAEVPTPFQSADLGCAGLVEDAEYWRLADMSIDAVQSWLERHVPNGFQLVGTGTGGDRTGRTMTEVDLAVRQRSLAPAGSRLVLMAVQDGSGAALRASAQVVAAAGCKSVHHAPALHGDANTTTSSAVV